MGKFYVYGLFYEDENEESVCFYVGSGTGNRKERHFREGVMKHCTNSYKVNKIKKLRRNGKKLYGKKLVENLGEDKARKLEQKLLDRDEVFNNTTNLNRAATGFSGKNHPTNGGMSESHKKALSESLTGRTLSKEHKLALSEALKGHEASEEEKERIRQSQLGDKNNAKDPEVREKISETLKGEDVGSDNPQAKFNRKQIKEIRRLWNNEKWKQYNIAEKYDCSQRTISKIVRNISYWDENYENRRGETITHDEINERRR